MIDDDRRAAATITRILGHMDLHDFNAIARVIVATLRHEGWRPTPARPQQPWQPRPGRPPAPPSAEYLAERDAITTRRTSP